MQNLFYIIFKIGSFPVLVLKKLYEALVLYPISLLGTGKIYTRRAVQSIVIEGYNPDVVWKFLTNDRNFNRWNISFDDLTGINKSENTGVVKKQLLTSEKGKPVSKLVFVKAESGPKEHRLNFLWTSEESRISLSYELQHLKSQTVLTRKVVFRTVGFGKHRMLPKFNADKISSEKELTSVKKLLNKMSVGNQIFQSILKSPMISQIRVS